MPIGRYYVVDEAARTILHGPLLLDSDHADDWPVQDGGTLVTEKQVRAGQYGFPEEPLDVPAELRGKIRSALAGNRKFLALSTPTSRQIADQVRDLTRQVNALARLTGHMFDSSDDT